MADKTEETQSNNIPSGEGVVGTGNDARLAMFDSIADESDRIIEEEASGDFEDTSTVENQADEEENADDLSLSDASEDEEGGTEEETEEDHSHPVQPTKFKIKVNGQDVELSQDEVIKRAQKVSAADEYLKEAAELKRLAKEEFEKQKVSQPSAEDVAKTSREERLALVRAIQMGTEEEALEALSKLQPTASPSINQDELARTVDERLSFQAATSKFQSEYADILADPTLRNLAIQKDAELQRNGDTRDYWERFQQVGNEIREWRDGLVKAAAPSKDPLKEKQQRKAASPQAPASANKRSGQVVDANDDDGEEDPQEIIAAAAKARGGPQWMRG